MLSHLSSCASERGLLSTVIVFEPLLCEYSTLEAPPRITNFREPCPAGGHRHRPGAGVEFNDELRGMSAEAFIERVLQGLWARYRPGDDFRFGNSREGDYDYIQALRSSTDTWCSPPPPWAAGTRQQHAHTLGPTTGSSSRLNNCWGARLP